MLLDSNIIIYSTQPQHAALRGLIADQSPVVSVVSYIEVLGFHGLTNDERAILEQFFESAVILPLTDLIAKRAVALRQARRMSLGDSIIGATALVHRCTLITHNIADFQWIKELPLLDPLSESPFDR